ncbi:hypothetical protein [Capnocytophaga granulosa]|uniref:hypothetical protein n=1 Tax=Capnocytophaga granulosa TaxID=45242 RepID=UPI0023F4AF31|nr:hypothetical protein [Capnocytophaga granulosa]
MKTQEKNVSLALSELNIEKEMENIEVVSNIFSKTEHKSYAICFLGGRSDIIFESKSDVYTSITKEYVENIVEKIYNQFEKSTIIDTLKIITGGQKSGISKVIIEKIKNLKQSNPLKEEKDLQLIAIVTLSDKSIRIDEGNDYVIKTENTMKKIEAMIDMAYLFVVFPGGKETLGDALIAYNFIRNIKEKNNDYRILLHPFWKNKGIIVEEDKIIHYFIDGNDTNDISFIPSEKGKIVELKQYIFSRIKKNKLNKLKNLKNAIVNYIDNSQSDKDILLAIDFNSYVFDKNINKFYNEYYATQEYINIINNIYEKNNHILWTKSNENIFGVSSIPNGKVMTGVTLEKKEREVDIVIDRKKPNSSFNSMAKEFNSKRYGQTLMFRAIKIEREEEKLWFSVMLLFNYQLPKIMYQTIRNFIEDFITVQSFQKVEDIFIEKNKSLFKQATQSAISQVFVRNMTHNIVSHVLVHLLKADAFSIKSLSQSIKKDAYIPQFNLENTYDIIEEKKKLSEIIQKIQLEDNDLSLYDEFLLAIDKKVFSSNTLLYSKNQLAILFNYISNRCFYLNEATYGMVNMVGIKKVYIELFRELDQNRILLNHISGIDNFRYSIIFKREYKYKEVIQLYDTIYNKKLELEKLKNQKEEIQGNIEISKDLYVTSVSILNLSGKNKKNKEICKNNNKNTFKWIDEIDEENEINKEVEKIDKDIEEINKKILEYYRKIKENKRIGEDDDISIQLPGEVLGQQAFYNIIENIIRNTAKHNTTNTEDEVKFIVLFSDYNNKYYKITISNSVQIKDIGRLVKNQNRRIREFTIDKGNYLRSHSLGLLEMKASAAFLRQIDIVEIDSEFDLPLLTACEYKGCLGYEFYVKKPEKYVFVFKEDNFLERKNIKSLENYGISFLKVNEFKNSIREGQVYSHEFIFLQEEVQDKLGELGECFYKAHNDKQTNRKERVEALSLLPERLMLIEKDFSKKLIDSKDIEDFEKKVWEQWEGKEDEEIDRNTTKVNQNICQDTIRETDIENGFDYEECRQVVFFDHLNNYRTWKNLTAGVNTSLVTIEPLSSAAQRKLPGFKNDLGEYVEEARKSPICQKLVEAYFNKVIVIDERIQRAAESIYPAKDGQGVKEAEIFNYINVLIPKKEEIDLAKEHFSKDDKNAIITYIDNIKKAEFLVIHYGILERIYNNDTNRTEAINKQLNKWVKVTRVIVTSGRGRQTLEHLPLSVNYLNISSLLYAFVENRNKYSINYILNQSRR